MNEELLTTEDLSRLLQVSKSTIKRWTDEGRLHCFRTPGGHRKFRTTDVHEFVLKYRYDVPNHLSDSSMNQFTQPTLLKA